MNYCVFIHTNHKQWLGAVVSQYSLKKNSVNKDRFDVAFIHTRDYPFLQRREGQLYLNDAEYPTFIVNDLKLGESGGGVGLWVGPGTDAHFAEIKVTPK